MSGSTTWAVHRQPLRNALQTYLPLGETELHTTAALSNDSLVLLQAAAGSTSRNGEVAVVTISGAVSSSSSVGRRSWHSIVGELMRIRCLHT